MSSSAQTATCACGQVLFDVADRKTGDIIKCPWCSEEYRFLGGQKIEPLGGKPLIVMEGTEEVFKFDAEKSPTSKVKALSTRGRKQATARLSPLDKPVENPKKKHKGISEPPGGVIPMVGFMSGGFVIAALVLGFVFPENHDKIRSAPWGGPLGLKSPWPDLIAFTLGQIFAFAAWACFLYYLHLKQKALAEELAANPEAAAAAKLPARSKAVIKRKPKVGEDDSDADDDEHESQR